MLIKTTIQLLQIKLDLDIIIHQIKLLQIIKNLIIFIKEKYHYQLQIDYYLK